MIICGDCLESMRGMGPNSVDAIVTDPPYGLSFMGKEWDYGLPGEPFWIEALRVAKPGCHILAFGGTRTFHRLACAIEDAGWEIRDCLMWVYGSGFPKSHNLKGEKVGWGTALKPAWEPIILARKPLDGTVAENVQKWATGAINVDGCRIGTDIHRGDRYGGKPPRGVHNSENITGKRDKIWNISPGRWPANLIHDGSEEVLAGFPHTKSGARSGPREQTSDTGWGNGTIQLGGPCDASSGSAARFFYCAKASRAEREMGLEGMEEREPGQIYGLGAIEGNPRKPAPCTASKAKNHHPTVKPLALMRYLCRLITPSNGLILDPFMGSGTTGIAAKQEDFNFLGIDNNLEYCQIAKKRINAGEQDDRYGGRGGDAEKDMPQMRTRNNARQAGLLCRTEARGQGLLEMPEMRT